MEKVPINKELLKFIVQNFRKIKRSNKPVFKFSCCTRKITLQRNVLIFKYLSLTYHYLWFLAWYLSIFTGKKTLPEKLVEQVLEIESIFKSFRLLSICKFDPVRHMIVRVWTERPMNLPWLLGCYLPLFLFQ